MNVLFMLTGACIFVALIIYGVVQLSKNISIKNQKEKE